MLNGNGKNGIGDRIRRYAKSEINLKSWKRTLGVAIIFLIRYIRADGWRSKIRKGNHGAFIVKIKINI